VHDTDCERGRQSQAFSKFFGVKLNDDVATQEESRKTQAVDDMPRCVLVIETRVCPYGLSRPFSSR
jgi:hypothetical protein